MQDFPHCYHVSVTAEPDGNIALKADDSPLLIVATAAEFGGLGDQWSPETLLVGAVTSGFALSFRTIAGTSKLAWNSLACSAEGVLEPIGGVARFTAISISATLTVPAGTDSSKAQTLLEQAEAACMITRSLLSETRLKTDIIVES